MNEEDISTYLPKYLSPTSFEELRKDITDFVAGINEKIFYSSRFIEPGNLYQGDGIKEMPFLALPSIAAKMIFAMIISNSCDCSPANDRLLPLSISYCPIVTLQTYVSILRQESISEERLKGHLGDIRSQKITNTFYLPATSGFDESIVFLDKVCHLDPSLHAPATMIANRSFSLSNFGFYLLLFKISIHFSRFNERVDRH